jgi:hypothetical protein
MQASIGSKFVYRVQEQIHRYLGGTFRADERVRRMGRDQDSPRTPTHKKPATHAPDTHSPLPISLQQRSSASPSGCLERVPPRNGYSRVLESQALWRPLTLTGGRDGARGGSLVSPKSTVAFFPCRPVSPSIAFAYTIPLVPSSSQPVLLISHLVTINNLTFTLSTFTFLYCRRFSNGPGEAVSHSSLSHRRRQ